MGGGIRPPKFWWDGIEQYDGTHPTTTSWCDKISNLNIGRDYHSNGRFNDKGMLSGNYAIYDMSPSENRTLTVESIVKAPSAISNAEGIFRQSYHANPGTNRWSWGFNSGKPFFWAYPGSERKVFFATAIPSQFILGARNALTITINKNIVSFYINGIKIGSSLTISGWQLPTSRESYNYNLTMVAQPSGWEEFNGCKVWDTILSDEEILLSSIESLNYYNS